MYRRFFKTLLSIITFLLPAGQLQMQLTLILRQKNLSEDLLAQMYKICTSKSAIYLSFF